jgi:hypothetical protein
LVGALPLASIKADINTPSVDHFDYRYGATFRLASPQARKILDGRLVHPQDASLRTYRGHQVFQTLIRSYFSPMHTTGQRYIYSGSSDGSVFSMWCNIYLAQLGQHWRMVFVDIAIDGTVTSL